MRRLLVLAILVVAAPAARAADHGARISEIGLSKAGDQTVQFVEIVDSFGGEPYPASPYKLQFFDVAGAPTNSVTLTISGAHSKWYVATAAADTAYGTTRDDLLTVSLPQNGQVCFQRNTGANISCVSWGCITTFVSPTVRAPTPPDNMSVSRQPDATFQVTTPTPNNTTNLAGSTIKACPTDPIDTVADDLPIPHDAHNGDAGNGNSGGGGGCCSVDGNDGALGGSLLAAITLVALRRRRRQPRR